MAVYVGTCVGETVGALLGDELGLGVGTLSVYVGVRVGSTVGALEGEALGMGVGLPFVTEREIPEAVAVAADESVTVLVDADTATTVVPALTP